MEILNPRIVKEPKIIGRKPKFTREYMMMVAKKVFDGDMTFREAAKTFGVSHGSINSWMTQYKKGNWGNATKVIEVNEKIKTQRLESQVRDLKHEIADLYLENMMLKKALQFSQQIKKENSSVITSENLDQLQRPAK